MSLLDASDRPLCPMSMGMAASHPVHNAWTLFQNLLYDATREYADEHGDLPEGPLEKVYSKVAYNQAYETMQLHHESRSADKYSPLIVEIYYFRCHLCGYILPANEVTR